MSVDRFKLPIKYVLGFPYPDYFVDEKIVRAIKWTPKDEDVIVATYPKCGTTWAQAMVWMIHHNGEGSIPRFNDLMIKLTPFLECIGVEAAEELTPPRHLKTHLPYGLTPRSARAKYISVARNPKDTCVSYYFFCKELFRLKGANACTFNQFFEEFIRGEVPYGDYFDHILSWHKHTDDENVLFLVYEQIMKNHSGTVMKIAKFLSSEENNYEKRLSQDANLLRTIVQKTTFDAMKTIPVRTPADFTDPRNVGEGGEMIEFFRKGTVGDWINFLNNEQINRIDELMKQKFGDLVNEFGWQ